MRWRTRLGRTRAEANKSTPQSFFSPFGQTYAHKNVTASFASVAKYYRSTLLIPNAHSKKIWWFCLYLAAKIADKIGLRIFKFWVTRSRRDTEFRICIESEIRFAGTTQSHNLHARTGYSDRRTRFGIPGSPNWSETMFEFSIKLYRERSNLGQDPPPWVKLWVLSQTNGGIQFLPFNILAHIDVLLLWAC